MRTWMIQRAVGKPTRTEDGKLELDLIRSNSLLLGVGVVLYYFLLRHEKCKWFLFVNTLE